MALNYKAKSIIKTVASHWIVLGLLAPMLMAGPTFARGHINLRIDGVARSAIVVVREPLKRQRRPVLIVLHGTGGSGARVRRALRLDQQVGTSGVVLVFPDAIKGRWMLNDKGAGGNADEAFIREIVTQLVSRGIAQPKHVFIAGVSTGGMMAMQMACTAPGMFVGAAGVLANMPTALSTTCKPNKPLPFLLINATEDQRVPFKGGATSNLDYTGSVVSTLETMKPFATAAGCKGEGTVSALPPPRLKTTLYTNIIRYGGCKAPVELYEVVGGGHTIPGRRIGHVRKNTHVTPGGADAANLIFNFSQRLKAAQ